MIEKIAIILTAVWFLGTSIIGLVFGIVNIMSILTTGEELITFICMEFFLANMILTFPIGLILICIGIGLDKLFNLENKKEKRIIKAETPEAETLSKIKLVLSMGNEAQAIRLIEQYGKWQSERMYSEDNMNEYADYVLMCSAEKTLKIPLHPRRWFEQFKKK